MHETPAGTGQVLARTRCVTAESVECLLHGIEGLRCACQNAVNGDLTEIRWNALCWDIGGAQRDPVARDLHPVFGEGACLCPCRGPLPSPALQSMRHGASARALSR